MKLANQILIVQLMVLLCGCTMDSNNSKSDGSEKSAFDLSKTPVLFVHGFGMSAEHWSTMINYLKDSGYPSQFLRAIQLIPNDGPNVDAAEKQIAPAVEKFLADANSFIAINDPQTPKKERIDLVSHSMGAVSSRWYAAKVRPERVRTWISLAGANHGSNALCAYVGNSGLGADDLCPAFAENEKESFVQFALNGLPYKADVDESPFGIGADSPGVTTIPPDATRRIFYVTIRTINDEWIVPDESAILDGAGGMNILIQEDLPASENPPGNVRMDNGVRHDPMLTDPATMRLVKTILEIKR